MTSIPQPAIEGKVSQEGLPHFATAGVLAIAAAKLLLHVLTSNRYGFFRDELYYLECGRHLAWGYVDQAPLIALLARLGLVLGGALPVFRTMAGIASAAAVVMAALIAREMGGRRKAQWLAALCVAVAPGFMIMGALFTMNAVEPLFWMGCIWLLLRIQRSGNLRLWIWFGALLGLGIENKHSAVFFGVAALAGILSSPLRKDMGTKWPWLGALVAFLIALPNFIWQVVHRFPTYELLQNVNRTGKNVVLSPQGFLKEQVLSLNPVTFLVWGAGLVWVLASRRGRGFGWMACMWAALFIIMVALKGKAYYFFPIAPMVMAMGAVAWESWSGSRRWPVAVLSALLIATGALFAPVFTPILPPAQAAAYMDKLHLRPARAEVGHVGNLPQYFGDQFGWRELTQDVAKVYNSLPPAERGSTGLFGNNYGEASALNYYGPQYGLPHAISAHQNYYYWGPQGFGNKGDDLIVLQDTPESLGRLCDSVEAPLMHYNEWGMAEENGPVLLCRGLKVNLADHWKELKKWR